VNKLLRLSPVFVRSAVRFSFIFVEARLSICSCSVREGGKSIIFFGEDLQGIRISTPDRMFIGEKIIPHCLLKVMWSGRSHWLFASGLFGLSESVDARLFAPLDKKLRL